MPVPKSLSYYKEQQSKPEAPTPFQVVPPLDPRGEPFWRKPECAEAPAAPAEVEPIRATYQLTPSEIALNERVDRVCEEDKAKARTMLAAAVAAAANKPEAPAANPPITEEPAKEYRAPINPPTSKWWLRDGLDPAEVDRKLDEFKKAKDWRGHGDYLLSVAHPNCEYARHAARQAEAAQEEVQAPVSEVIEQTVAA
jgi:hypothetical protein